MRRAGVAATREALSRAGASIAGELAVLSSLAEAPVEPVVVGASAGHGSAQSARRASRCGASLARLCALCERSADLKEGLQAQGRLPGGAADHLDGLLADADRALREAERGDVPTPGLAPWRAEKLAAALRAC